MSFSYKPGQLSALFGVSHDKTVISPNRKLPTFKDVIIPQFSKKQRYNIPAPKISIIQQNKQYTNNKQRKWRNNSRSTKRTNAMDSKSRDFRDASTVFLGNIPRNWKQSNIRNFLQQWRKNIESITFSNYISKVKQKKLQMHRNPIISNVNKLNKNCWVRMSDEKYARSALVMNNSVIHEEINEINTPFTIRVDMCNARLNCNNSLSLFLGNLPPSTTEELIREFFVSYHCTDILNVRIIRDRVTQISKNCGFIQFSDVRSYATAMDLNGSEFSRKLPKKERVFIRVMPWMKEMNQMKDDMFDNQRNHLKRALINKPNARTNVSGNEFMKDENTSAIFDGKKKYKVKRRWRDHPEMRLKCELRKKQISIQRILMRNAKGLNVKNRNQSFGREMKSNLNDRKNATFDRLELELKTQTMITEQLQFRKKVKQRKWIAKHKKIKHIIDNKKARKAKMKMRNDVVRKRKIRKHQKQNATQRLEQMGIDPQMFDDPAYN